MLDIKFITPEIQRQSIKDGALILVANIAEPIKLFQGQKIKVKTGVAINTDAVAMAFPLMGNNMKGLIMASGSELIDSSGEVEVLLWNRNAQGTPQMIEIVPGMPIAKLVFMSAVVPDLPKPEPEAVPVEPETEKTLEQLGIKDLRAILDMKAADQGLESAMYKQKDTKSDLIALIRGVASE